MEGRIDPVGEMEGALIATVLGDVVDDGAPEDRDKADVYVGREELDWADVRRGVKRMVRNVMKKESEDNERYIWKYGMEANVQNGKRIRTLREENVAVR